MKGRLRTKPLATILVIIFLFATAFIVAVPSLVSADQEGYYTYTAYLGNATITGYSGPGGPVEIPESLGGYPVVAIGDSAFLGSSLTSVTIPSSVTSIGGHAFSACLYLNSVTMPNSLTSIGEHAFAGCILLNSMNIPSSVISIGYLSFGSCTSLTAINVDSNNVNYASVDGVLYSKDMTRLFECPAGKTEALTIPERVITIEISAFSDSALASVTVPSSVTSIGSTAFYECTSLKAIYFNGNAPGVGSGWVMGASQDLVVYYHEGATGFTNPWNGVPTIMIDTTPPIISGYVNGETVKSISKSTWISASFSDSGVGVDASSILVFVNGQDITGSPALIKSSSGIQYPTALLSKGSNTIYVQIKDTAGNLAGATWIVKVTGGALKK